MNPGDDDWDEDVDYGSGPFCRHWAELGDCDVMCVCGHGCNSHWDGACDVAECECAEWREVAP